MRFSDSLKMFREQLPHIGAVHTVRVECQSYLPDWRPDRPYREGYAARRNEGGVLRDLIHEIDYATWCFGWPTRLFGRVQNLGRLGIDADEIAELSWQAPTGELVSIHVDYLTRPVRRRMCAYGAQGSLEWDAIQQTVTLWPLTTTPQTWTLTQPLDAMFSAQANAFVQATGSRRDPRLASSEDGLKALAICDAARRASETQREDVVRYE